MRGNTCLPLRGFDVLNLTREGMLHRRGRRRGRSHVGAVTNPGVEEKNGVTKSFLKFPLDERSHATTRVNMARRA